MASPKRETSIYPSQIVKDAPRRLGNTHDMYKAGAATHKEAESMPGTLSKKVYKIAKLSALENLKPGNNGQSSKRASMEARKEICRRMRGSLD
ncbi:hypothetical protein M8818_001831 [Zalaria obscura]|uniref:Uncharacterized protein n=1 Tax=Zalaria obscura TaxID=2024903 RepID=A0ACC3SK04_9PEZI